MTLYWLSFAGEEWLGGTTVEVEGTGKEGLQQAIQRAWALGINPGGEIKSFEVPAEHTGVTKRRAIKEGSFERLVGRVWAEKYGEKI